MENSSTIMAANIASYSFLLIAIGLFARAAWTDFRRWKIENKNVLWLILAYAVYAGASLLANPLTDLVNLQYDALSAILLFVTGFVFWQLRMFGAGDAKLLFPIGLFIGWEMLFAFAINLAIFAVVVTLLLKLPIPLGTAESRLSARIKEIRQTNKIPYGVILVLALFLTLAMKFA